MICLAYSEAGYLILGLIAGAVIGQVFMQLFSAWRRDRKRIPFQ